jgi:viroplasmin and RNaseH domain-containing protein
MSFYAVANGRVNGVFRTWSECNNSVKGFKNAIYKKFNGEEDAIKFSKSIKKYLARMWGKLLESYVILKMEKELKKIH